MSFQVSCETKIFACQNPLHQGGGRKGLPKSFLNRFTQVRPLLVELKVVNSPLLFLLCNVVGVCRCIVRSRLADHSFLHASHNVSVYSGENDQVHTGGHFSACLCICVGEMNLYFLFACFLLLQVSKTVEVEAFSWEFNLRDVFRWCELMLKYQVSWLHLAGKYTDRLKLQ